MLLFSEKLFFNAFRNFELRKYKTATLKAMIIRHSLGLLRNPFHIRLLATALSSIHSKSTLLDILTPT